MNDERTPDSKDPWESEMSREFDKRVRDLHEAPLTFESVRGKAMTIRRKRRMAVAGGVLAAAAVVVPVAVYAGNDLVRSADERRDFATSSPTPTESPAGALGVSYLEGRTWHRVGGAPVELATRYDGGTELGTDLLAVRNDEGRLTVDVVEDDGTLSESFDTFSYPVANADRTTAAYVATDGTLMTRWADGEVAMGEGFVDGDSVAAVTGGPSCYESVDGCQVFVNHGDGSTPEVLDSHGLRDLATPDAIKVNDVSPDGLVAAQTSSSDAGSCSEVYDRRAGAAVFETCDYSFDGFSPDGAYLSGTDAYRDGIGQGYVVILDAATGDEVARWEATEGFASSWVWEDETHLLVNAYERGEWRLYRLGVEGSTEQVLSSDEGDDTTPAFIPLGGS